MLQNIEEQRSPINGESKNAIECEEGESLNVSLPNSPNQSSRPSSMVIKKPNRMIPPHLIAEAISTLPGFDLRWSGPITPSEMQYVQQYVFAKYPEYCNGLVEDLETDKIELCINEDSSEPMSDDKKRSQKMIRDSFFSPSFTSNNEMCKVQLEPSKLLETLAKKTSFQGNFISIPEIQARNRALQDCGLTEEEYLVIFTANVKESMVMIGESYPFFRGNYYLTILGEETDSVKNFVSSKDSKAISAPETWLNLRIKGSQLSQYFRRKSKYTPKGLFAYPACTNGARSSMHWISEAHRNSWHVLLDASGLELGEDRLALALHQPDFVTCVVDVAHAQPSKISCLLVRKNSFDTAASST
ncbi:uncharacterized protein [Primulina huaijiensis]|uniref:uncharacterized protein n=1 Tax=Primulina huaijiensis TaxID=1492673 RepID=UPI003CC773F2